MRRYIYKSLERILRVRSSTSNDKALIVEFTGVTGVGKSTLVTVVKEMLVNQGFLAHDAYDFILAAYGINPTPNAQLKSILIDLIAFPSFVYHSFTTKQGFVLLHLAIKVITRDARTLWEILNLLRNFVKRVGVHLLLKKLCYRLDQFEFVICDEGILHVAHNLFVHQGIPPDPNEVLRFGRLISLPEIIVWVKAPKEKSVKCILQRGHSRVDRSPAAARMFVNHGCCTFEALCENESIRNRLLIIDNTLPIQVTASTITEYLSQKRAESEQADYAQTD